MRLLLDTHTFLWWATNDRRLSRKVRGALSDPDNEILVSAASAWEIAIKQRLGKLGDVPHASEQFAELVLLDGFVHLPMSHLHASRAGAYALAHRDPFDRMLAAQAELEGVPLVTRDRALEAFPCKRYW